MYLFYKHIMSLTYVIALNILTFNVLSKSYLLLVY